MSKPPASEPAVRRPASNAATSTHPYLAGFLSLSLGFLGGYLADWITNPYVIGFLCLSLGFLGGCLSDRASVLVRDSHRTSEQECERTATLASPAALPHDLTFSLRPKEPAPGDGSPGIMTPSSEASNDARPDELDRGKIAQNVPPLLGPGPDRYESLIVRQTSLAPRHRCSRRWHQAGCQAAPRQIRRGYFKAREAGNRGQA